MPTLIEFCIATVWILIIATQIIVPGLRNQRMFPLFRKRESTVEKELINVETDIILEEKRKLLEQKRKVLESTKQQPK